jgi:LysM repeat protein
VLSVITALNIFHLLGSAPKQPTANQTQSTQQQVLGAYSQNTAQVQTTIYTVQHGDTLFDIAQSHGVSWQVIAALNNLSQPYTLKAGSQLKIPSAQ